MLLAMLLTGLLELELVWVWVPMEQRQLAEEVEARRMLLMMMMRTRRQALRPLKKVHLPKVKQKEAPKWPPWSRDCRRRWHGRWRAVSPSLSISVPESSRPRPGVPGGSPGRRAGHCGRSWTKSSLFAGAAPSSLRPHGGCD